MHVVSCDNCNSWSPNCTLGQGCAGAKGQAVPARGTRADESTHTGGLCGGTGGASATPSFSKLFIYEKGCYVIYAGLCRGEPACNLQLQGCNRTWMGTWQKSSTTSSPYSTSSPSQSIYSLFYIRLKPTWEGQLLAELLEPDCKSPRCKSPTPNRLLYIKQLIITCER